MRCFVDVLVIFVIDALAIQSVIAIQCVFTTLTVAGFSDSNVFRSSNVASTGAGGGGPGLGT